MTHGREPARERTLDQDIPELHDFLQPGMKILDLDAATETSPWASPKL